VLVPLERLLLEVVRVREETPELPELLLEEDELPDRVDVVPLRDDPLELDDVTEEDDPEEPRLRDDDPDESY